MNFKTRNLCIRILRSISNNSLSSSSSSPYRNFTRLYSPRLALLSTPWSVTQLRPKFCGSDVRPGNVIERKGRIYQVVKTLHRTPGKGGALIQVELRDVDSGNKVNERLRTDEAIERVYVEQKRLTYLYTDEETESVVLMEPKTYEQVEVPKALFGESFAYLKDDMSVTVELYDDKPMSASVPPRVTCTVVETQVPVKGIGATPHTKKALLDNGLSVQVPAHILTGDQLLIDTTDHSYMSSLSKFLRLQITDTFNKGHKRNLPPDQISSTFYGCSSQMVSMQFSGCQIQRTGIDYTLTSRNYELTNIKAYWEVDFCL